jgi:hypothetical protein
MAKSCRSILPLSGGKHPTSQGSAQRPAGDARRPAGDTQQPAGDTRRPAGRRQRPAGRQPFPAARYKASMDKLDRLLACPKLCRGKECTGIPCREEELGFPYSHIDNMVVCTDKAHVSMATRAGCLMFHQWPKSSPRPPQAPPAGPPAGRPKNSGGEPRARGMPPPRDHAGKGTQRQQLQP